MQSDVASSAQVVFCQVHRFSNPSSPLETHCRGPQTKVRERAEPVPHGRRTRCSTEADPPPQTSTDSPHAGRHVHPVLPHLHVRVRAAGGVCAVRGAAGHQRAVRAGAAETAGRGAAYVFYAHGRGGQG